MRKQIFECVKKDKFAVKSQKVIFENSRNCSPSELHGGSLFRTFNSYEFIQFQRWVMYQLLSAGKYQPGRRALSVIFEK